MACLHHSGQTLQSTEIFYSNSRHLHLKLQLDETLKDKQYSTAEQPNGMFNKPSKFMNYENYITNIDYLL